MLNKTASVSPGLLICLLFIATLAQNKNVNINVYGTVVDPNEAVIPNTSVTLKNLLTKDTLRTVTNEEGAFVFENVKPGRYELSAEIFWSDKYSVTVLLEEGKNKEVNIKLGLHRCPDRVKRLSEKNKKEISLCTVHHKRLQLDIVRIIYGLVIISEDEVNEAFPNANKVYYGGCVADCYEKAEVLFC